MKMVPRIIKTSGEMAWALVAAGLELALEAGKAQIPKKKAAAGDKVAIKPKNPRVWLWPS
ncbi:MAG: hypothetical protein V1816_24460 [Pseudomonadota bacterium]